ncbi:MAG: hypothetical protein J6X77_00220 [Bacteroidales bacterium]|nr:hypothetical protein [Bacteroidales bacterium]
MLRSCSSADALRRLQNDNCDTQFVFVFEEFEFCIKELVFEEHFSDKVLVIVLD